MSSARAETLARTRARLLAARTDGGAFCGRLSESALSTATAVMAFALAARVAAHRGEPDEGKARLAEGGRAWLRANQNADGGWGDTTDSLSNISTTVLCWASLGVVDPGASAAALARAEQWLTATCGKLTPERLAAAIRARYGRDYTFSVPILTTCAIGGRLGEGRAAWRLVPALPFELAACPHQWFGWMQLRTVSYALPALIAIGQARHHHRPTANPVTRLLRNLTRRRTLRILEQIQPASGGFLEAAPLTSFVAMSLISIGLDRHPVVDNGLRFLTETVRTDGSWPIDSNLNTWTTTLSVQALAAGSPLETAPGEWAATRSWLLDQQYRQEHPYTHSDPGGWAWTDLSGGVPDGDDSPGALLALHQLRQVETEAGAIADIGRAAAAGVGWLLDLQNRDGGIPTFCRGWGKLPFDRSSPDLTAHTLRAWAAWREQLPALQQRIDRATVKAVRYLCSVQQQDGTWVPLWFGNQQAPAEENPLFGTSRVLRAVAAVRCCAELDAAWASAGGRGRDWLLLAQAPDGGFGANAGVPPSIEETALATEALAAWQLAERPSPEGMKSAVARGADWLAQATAGGTQFPASPIGLYFAKLWYAEQLYPVIFTAGALALAERCRT